jgi:hypothetical protein
MCYIICSVNTYWVVLGIWWCEYTLMIGLPGLPAENLRVVFQEPRPGPGLPKGEHYLTIGWKQVNIYRDTVTFAHANLRSGLR